MANFECPSCECFIVTAPPAIGTYEVTYAECSDEAIPYKYVEIGIPPLTVKYICAVPGSVILSPGAFFLPCTLPLCSSCVKEGDCVPEAFCYVVDLGDSPSATFRYVEPSGLSNILVTETLSVSSGITSLNVCARQGSIQTLSGVIVISAPGVACTSTEECNALP